MMKFKGLIWIACVFLQVEINAQISAEKKIQTEMILVEDGGNVSLDA